MTGLKENVFYWEILITNTRKIVLVLLGTVLNDSSANSKVRNVTLSISANYFFNVGNYWNYRDLC